MNAYPVLLFHSTDDRDLLSLRDLGNIRPALFEKLIVRLKKEFEIVRLDEMVRCISEENDRKEDLLALTFDDGPKSYAAQSVPILQAYGVPSTCFLITDCIADTAIYWRYFYNYCIHKGLGRELAVLINNEYKTGIGPGEIISFSRSTFNRAKNQRITETLLNGVVSEEEYRKKEKELFLSLEDIGKLNQDPLVNFGIHTRSHPVLRRLSDDEIYDEIAGSLEFYRSRIGDDVPAFSIPFGRLYMDYDERAIAAARSLGIKVILSAYGGGNGMRQPLYNIRRIPVHEDKLIGGIDLFVETLHAPSVPAGYGKMEERLSGLLSVKT